MVTAADLGDPTSPDGDIHPANKTEVGRRVAYAIDKLCYDIERDSAHDGPRVSSVKVVDQGVRVTFEEDSVGDGVHLEGAQVCPEDKFCGGILLQGEDGDFKIDEVRIVDKTTIDFIGGDAGQNWSGMSYGWGDIPLMVVYSSYGIPLRPLNATVT